MGFENVPPFRGDWVPDDGTYPKTPLALLEETVKDIGLAVAHRGGGHHVLPLGQGRSGPLTGR